MFKDTEIIQTEYSTIMSTCPTIFLSFVDAKGDKNNIVTQMKLQLLGEYKGNEQVFKNIGTFERPTYDVILRGTSDIQNGSLKDVVNAISFLMTKCHQYYGKRVMLFIDE